MSVTFTWDNPEQTQLRFVFDALWQLEDLAEVIHVSHYLITDRGEIVDIVIDMSASDSVPTNLLALRDQLQDLDNSRVGVMVFVTHNIYLPKVMQLFNQLLHHTFTMYFTDSLEDAHRIVQRATTTRQSHIG